MVQEGNVLGHKLSKKGIDADKAWVNLIFNLPVPCSRKQVRYFLGHAGFCRSFIKDFSEVT